MTETLTDPVLDSVDRQLMHALGVNARVSFRLLASVLEVSEQTAARRYHRLRDAGVLRVLMLPAPDPADRGQLVRLEVQPQAVRAIADVLARRPDVSYVRLMSAGAEILFGVRARARSDRDSLLFDQLPRAGRILRTTVYSLLKHFRTPGEADWAGFGDPLNHEQRRRLATDRPDEPSMCVEPSDHAIVDELAVDGRATYARLAQVSGMSESAVARRVELLTRTGALYGDIDIAPELLGYPAVAQLYLDVVPSRVPEVGTLLAAHAPTAFVAAVAGPANLLAAIRCRNVAEIYEYVTATIGRVEGVNRVEVSTVSRTVKHARSTTDENRLSRVHGSPGSRMPSRRRTMAP